LTKDPARENLTPAWVASSQYGQGSGRANRNPNGRNTMNPMKRMGLKLFSLCVLALGLVAFSAAAAQAEGTWMYKGVDLISSAQNKEIVGRFEKGTDGTLLSTLGLNTVNFLCTAAQLVNAILEPEGKISETNKNAKFAYSGCTTTINGTTAKTCEPKATGKPTGTIETEEFYALLELHKLLNEKKEVIGTDAVIVFTPKVGTVFVILHMSEACAIGEEVKLFGSLARVDVGGDVGTLEEKRIHIVEPFKPLTKLKIANTKSEGTVTLDSKIEIELSSGEVWNGLYK
jgi:hypothetical protein